jgi:hypothetical protein
MQTLYEEERDAHTAKDAHTMFKIMGHRYFIKSSGFNIPRFNIPTIAAVGSP